MAKKINDIAEQVLAMAQPIAAAQGAEVIDVEWVKEAGEWILRVTIDRSDMPVDHNLCEAVSRGLSDALDEADPIPQNYFLEISSPGIERPLKKEADYQRFLGETVKVKLFAPVDGKKEFQGTLLGLIEGTVSLQDGDKVYQFSLEQIAKAHLVADF